MNIWQHLKYGKKDKDLEMIIILQEIRPHLEVLQTSLKTFKDHQRDPLVGALTFSRIVSKCHDEVLKTPYLNDRHKQYDKFVLAISRHGRSHHGMNRTASGQPVTISDVFLGNPPASIASWMARERNFPLEEETTRYLESARIDILQTLGALLESIPTKDDPTIPL